MTRRDFAKFLAVLAVLYLLLSPLEPPDFPEYVYPWLRHIDAKGPIGAFGEPFSNYTPPYLYLLSALSLLPLPDLAIIKLLAIACLGWLAWCVARLVQSLGCEERLSAVAFALALPTVIFNGPGLGQCDSIWVGCCLLSVAAAADRRTLAMAAWASAAFAFKAQAAFLAPFVLALVIRDRKWAALTLTPAIYLLAVSPALLAGWPLIDLFTIYTWQATAWFEGNAPNLWAIPVALGYPGPFLLGYFLASLSAVGIVLLGCRDFDRKRLPYLALLSAILIPFLLPKMHERFFFLADVLAFCVAYWKRDRSSIALCALTQIASVASIIAYLGPLPWLNVLASIAMGAALMLCAKELRLVGSSYTRGQHRDFQSVPIYAPSSPRPSADPMLREQR